MNSKDHGIYIVGAGVSGLIAARVLENYGYSPVIYEASDRPGGRLKTNVNNGYQLDRGFQVLLDAYPKAGEYLNLEELDLQRFAPGAVIFSKGKQQKIGDPLRDPSLLLPTLFSGTGTVGDKLKILKLKLDLKRKSVEEIFSSEEMSSLKYLKEKGFSDKIIDRFFRPFFSGIFLEPNLETSGRMLQFVYKMFGEGYASLPKKGIEAIPKQLSSGLKNTRFHFNTPVARVSEGRILLENGREIISDYTLIATDPGGLVTNLKDDSLPWHSCDNFYFETKHRNIDKPLIGLVADKEALVNNIFFYNSLELESEGEKELLSATVVKAQGLDPDKLLARVERDLKEHCDIKELKFLAHYRIEKALPALESVQYEIAATETKLSNSIFLAGDQMLNASLNAAMTSGERAALGIVKSIEGNLLS